MLLIVFILFSTTIVNFTELTRGDEELVIGRIHGITYQKIGWTIYFVPFVFVKTENKQNISNLSGHYELNGLQINHEYIVTAKRIGFRDTIVSVMLTDAEPDVELNLELILKDNQFKSGPGHMS